MSHLRKGIIFTSRVTQDECLYFVWWTILTLCAISSCFVISLTSWVAHSVLPYYLYYVARVKYHHLLHEACGCEDLKQLTRVREFARSVILQDNINKPNEILSQVSEVKKGRFCWRQIILCALPRPWLQLKLLKIHSNCRKVISVIDD